MLGFFIKFWDDTYKGVILTEQQVRDAVTAKLMAVHSKEKKAAKKAATKAAAAQDATHRPVLDAASET